MHIIKRNGKEVAYDKNKIIAAVEKANQQAQAGNRLLK